MLGRSPHPAVGWTLVPARFHQTTARSLMSTPDNTYTQSTQKHDTTHITYGHTTVMDRKPAVISASYYIAASIGCNAGKYLTPSYRVKQALGGQRKQRASVTSPQQRGRLYVHHSSTHFLASTHGRAAS